MPKTKTTAKSHSKGRRWNHNLTVVGLNFRWKKENRAVLAAMLAKSSISGIRLEREPESEYDANAIAVYLPVRVFDGKQLGYLGRETAAVLAPKFDAGTLVVESCTLLGLQDDGAHPNALGHMVVAFRDVLAK
jgi:hypothetical protein